METRGVGQLCITTDTAVKNKKMAALLKVDQFYDTYKSMENISIYTKFNVLPDNLKNQVMNFIDSLLERIPKNKKAGKPKTPKFGSCIGMFEMSPDFDEPLEDFKDYMY